MPYYVKNVFLFGIQVLLLFVIYVVYFRADGGSLENAYKIFMGLNRNTFNYLSSADVRK